ncbi:hypothetical protein C5D04_00500 [Rathayibacter sp. AY1D2]|nr:hypothetical protein C5D04_00500 [Rathayibacter sp. AY1D2]
MLATKYAGRVRAGHRVAPFGYSALMDEHVYQGAATAQDAPELAALARAEMPTMTFLHDPDRWAHRFDTGTSIRSSWTLVLRAGHPSGELIGFSWVDDAMFVDANVVEPWWCINALVVAPEYRRRGYGTGLLKVVLETARAAGAVLVYGQSLPAAIPFWREAGFIIGGEEEALRTHHPARRATGDPVMLTMAPGHSDRWFVKYTVSAKGSVQSGLLPASLL